MEDIKKTTDLINKQIYVHKKGDSIDHHLRNSIPLKMLMQNEADGLGHITITQLLDVLQDLYISGQTDNYDDLETRRKQVKPIK
ncbi:hypothetical protein MZM54_00990 [[Brevibacterium] frigoritolerans]|nr:hypothetical protein [Peribacillus frigoritolerans]